ncbi:uncharacterized protein EI97DRAFT_482329 [Westerdykella ornata]|uniref:Uncharacterized protein n=1 Tax=Westerdykella ornata TaxID=318751 RepID=A0A6A6JSS0_WESOR|nr:uncharacterized protein EI97DRAFT_482329 [Westerdykella ornata]KAF2279650.1 hypothetical protein EI97DRAFT_482329 [Westerdykella ornata]
MAGYNQTIRFSSVPARGPNSTTSGSSSSPTMDRKAASDIGPFLRRDSSSLSYSGMSTPSVPQSPGGVPIQGSNHSSGPGSFRGSVQSSAQVSPSLVNEPLPVVKPKNADTIFMTTGFGSTRSNARGPRSNNWRENARPIPGTENWKPAYYGNRVVGETGNNFNLAAFLSQTPTIEESQAIPTGNFLVDLERERTALGAHPNRPQFLSHFGLVASEDDYYRQVLPYIGRCSFVLKSSADIDYLHDILCSPALPQAIRAISNLVMPKMYWFSGVRENRKANPFLVFMSRLPEVREVTITFHTGGLTGSAFTERDRLRIEAEDLDRSKQLKVLRLNEIIRFYDLPRLFDCKSLRKINLQCITSDMVSRYTKGGHPLAPFMELVGWVRQGFVDVNGYPIEVTATIVNPQRP